MKEKTKQYSIAVLFTVIGFLMIGCMGDTDSTDNRLPLPGNITFHLNHPASDPINSAETGAEIAVGYSEYLEGLKYQWMLDGKEIQGADSVNLKPKKPGKYTVKLEHRDYLPTTSGELGVTGIPLLPGIVEIRVNNAVSGAFQSFDMGTELVAVFVEDRNEKVSSPIRYQWIREADGVRSNIQGATSNRYTPRLRGFYNVRVEADGYQPIEFVNAANNGPNMVMINAARLQGNVRVEISKNNGSYADASETNNNNRINVGDRIRITYMGSEDGVTVKLRYTPYSGASSGPIEVSALSITAEEFVPDANDTSQILLAGAVNVKTINYTVTSGSADGIYMSTASKIGHSVTTGINLFKGNVEDNVTLPPAN